MHLLKVSSFSPCGYGFQGYEFIRFLFVSLGMRGSHLPHAQWQVEFDCHSPLLTNKQRFPLLAPALDVSGFFLRRWGVWWMRQSAQTHFFQVCPVCFLFIRGCAVSLLQIYSCAFGIMNTGGSLCFRGLCLHSAPTCPYPTPQINNLLF